MAGSLPRIVTVAIPGPGSLALAQRLSQVECAEITYLSTDFPIFWSKASGALVTDVDGNTFLDATSSFGVLGVGHCHPAVRRAIAAQSRTLIHGMGDVHPSDLKVELLESIKARVPIPDARIILGQNGSDAVEAALKTACLATGRSGVLAFEGGYHGLSYGALDATSRGLFRDPFVGQRGNFTTHLPFGCDVERIWARLSDDRSIGAVIVEPIQGRGGIRIPPSGWLARLREMCSRTGVLLILDEIFTGWGRTGNWFACDYDDVSPDLLCVGKAMGGGMPISACVGSRDLMESAWGSHSSGESRHTYTFLGHPLSCASAVAAIGVIERENLVERSRVLGLELLRGLDQLRDAHPNIVAEARGRGLMAGLALIQPGQAATVMHAALKHGLIVLPAGDNGEVVEIVPPFIVTSNQLTWALEVLDLVLGELSASIALK